MTCSKRNDFPFYFDDYLNTNSLKKCIFLDIHSCNNCQFLLMKPYHFLWFVLFFCSFFQLQAQDRYKPSNTEIGNLPLWAQKMYAQRPNVLEVDQLYRSYYDTHSFQKNYHTQYYKKWRRQVADRIDQDGYATEWTLTQKKARIEYQPSHSRNANWSVLGPFVVRASDGDTVAEQSNVYAVDQCTNAPHVWYCGTETGEVYRSVDNAETWINVSLSQNFDGGITALEIHPNNPDIVFAGSGDFLLKSIDAGNNWTLVMAINNLQANEILILPNSPDTILLAGNAGLYRSTDAGNNWSQVFNQRSYDLKARVSNSDTLYLVKNNPSLNLCEFFSSSDAGVSWQQQTLGWHSSTDAGRNDGGARLAVTAANPDRIYAYLIGESKTGDTGYIGLYRSDDGGQSWTLPNGPAGGPYTATHANLAIGSSSWQYHQGFYNCALTASNNNADHILLGGLNLYKSDDAGASFSPLAGYVGGNYDIHVDMQDFRTVGNSTIISTDGGIYHSNDFFASNTFRVKMKGIHAADYWGFGQGWNEDVTIGGLYHNGNMSFHENYGPGNFLQLGGGEPASGYVNPGENRKVYSSDINGKVMPLQIGDPVASIGFGINPNESYWAAESSELEFWPSCYNSAITGFENELWRTDDGCNSFYQWATFGNNSADRITYIEFCKTKPAVIYVCQQQNSPAAGKLWKTTDGGQNWQQLPLPAISGNSKKIVLQVDPIDENKLWLAFANGPNGNKVFSSSNGGLNWTNLTTAALNNENIHSLVYIPNSNEGLYVGTNKGIWYRDNTLNNWIDYSAGLPIEINCNIAKPFYRDGLLRLASYGRGLWETALVQQPSSPIAQISVDKLSSTIHCTLDSFYFVDQSIINHHGASWHWQFPGGSPALDSSLYPVVSYPTAGTFTVFLTVTDSSGNSSTDSLILQIDNFQAPTFVDESFETSFPPFPIELYNPDNGQTWEQSSLGGGYGLSTKTAWFNNFDYWPGGDEDDLRMSINFIQPSSTWLKFDVAYAQYAVNYSDSLEVLISTDCGQNFQSLYFKGGSDLATSANINTAFVPTATEWRTDSIDLSSYSNTAEIMLAFRNHSGWGNNIFLDNINLSASIISGQKQQVKPADLSIYPNPVGSEGQLYFSEKAALNFRLYNAKGQLVVEEKVLDGRISLPCLASGSYFYTAHAPKLYKRGVLIIR